MLNILDILDILTTGHRVFHVPPTYSDVLPSGWQDGTTCRALIGRSDSNRDQFMMTTTLIALQVKEQECEISREAASRVTCLNNPNNEIINLNNYNNLKIDLNIYI